MFCTEVILQLFVEESRGFQVRHRVKKGLSSCSCLEGLSLTLPKTLVRGSVSPGSSCLAAARFGNGSSATRGTPRASSPAARGRRTRPRGRGSSLEGPVPVNGVGWEGDKGEELRSYMGHRHIVFVWGGVGQERTFLWNFNPIPHWPTKHHKRWLLGGMTSLIGAEGPKS
jgi:hypothetical protein